MAATGHEDVAQAAVAQGMVSEEIPLILFFDLDAYITAIGSLKAFPENFLHTLAVKSNPTLRCVMNGSMCSRLLRLQDLDRPPPIL